jgi:hypothetical protein
MVSDDTAASGDRLVDCDIADGIAWIGSPVDYPDW